MLVIAHWYLPSLDQNWAEALNMHKSDLPQAILDLLKNGTVIPAHPLALLPDRTIDVVHQRALSRYYLDAGAGGLAVGVHTTQFAIREHGLYETVLQLAAEQSLSWVNRPVVMVAGLSGLTAQACQEARLAKSLGYHAGLLSLRSFHGSSEDQMILHCQKVANEIPIIGFYLQPAVGGPLLSASFWQRFANIDNVVAIKIAPFNRYRTLDVVRGLVLAGAEERITLYTGNDDHIVLDLIAPISILRNGERITVQIKGGLLGHWSVWTQQAVRYFKTIQDAVQTGHIDMKLLSLDSQITDANSALFDVANDFSGCIAGCHEILRRQGLLKGIWCLDPEEGLSPGQMQAIDRVYKDHPDLHDDEFVRTHLDRWLS